MNPELSDSSKQKCFDLIGGKLPIEEFEQWVYDSKELESAFSKEDHLELISFDFKKGGARYELIQLLARHVDLGEYEMLLIKRKLECALLKHKNLPQMLADFYDLYCRGYGFLQDVAMGFGLTIVAPPSENYDKSWEQLSKEEQDNIVKGFYPELEVCLKEVIRWLDTGKIVLAGETVLNENSFYEYHDYRTETERKSRLFKEVRKKWWQFWKPKLKQGGDFAPD